MVMAPLALSKATWMLAVGPNFFRPAETSPASRVSIRFCRSTDFSRVI